MMIRRFAAASALVAVLLTAGCARDAVSPGAPPATPTTTAPSLPADPRPSDPGDAVGQTVTGTVTAGVEPNCLLLSGGGTNYLLIFDDQALRGQAAAGEEITVVGRADPSMMTTCQEGTPFIVSAVRPN